MLAMLARVAPRSRPVPVGFQLVNIDGPKGELVPGIWGANGLRCGIDPARNLERRVEELGCGSEGSRPGEGVLLKGLWVGVGLEVLAAKDGMFKSPLLAPPGENLEGKVPARARLGCGRLSEVGSCAKSGKPSVGDSGMFSRRGVELPLVGGPPQGLGNPLMPSCC